uniref:Uncharacterized protein n=1 Tax=Arundo donax TaxID=35708 RepID=A0A0A9E629_ARUDO
MSPGPPSGKTPSARLSS